MPQICFFQTWTLQSMPTRNNCSRTYSLRTSLATITTTSLAVSQNSRCAIANQHGYHSLISQYSIMDAATKCVSQMTSVKIVAFSMSTVWKPSFCYLLFLKPKKQPWLLFPIQWLQTTGKHRHNSIAHSRNVTLKVTGHATMKHLPPTIIGNSLPHRQINPATIPFSFAKVTRNR